MNLVPGRHWIAGEWRQATGAAVFELRQRVPPHERLGSWPRADRGLLAEALGGAAGALACWRDAPPAERTAVLRRAAELVRADAAWREHLDRYLGLRGPELDGEVRALDEAHEALGAAPADGLAPAGVSVVFAHWTELVGRSFARIAAHLHGGRGVLVASDERWPAGIDAIGRALDAAGVPAGLVSIVHGAQEAAREALSGEGPAGGGARLGDGSVPFSVDAGDGTPGNRSYVVEAGADVARAAADVVQRAFGRAETLSGQRPGRVGRVICNRTIFSTFTEELLAAMQGSADVRDPVPVIDGRAFGELRSVWELGLDEGATLIFGGETFTGGMARSSDRRVWAAVFTNVEVGMAICRSPDATPVLCLVRSQSDQDAQELARRLG